MKNTKLLIGITVLFFFSFSTLVTAQSVAFIDAGEVQSYCHDDIPSGTFALKLSGGNCSSYTYTWSGISSNGCNGSNEPITGYTSYPTVTTTYTCHRVSPSQNYYFTVHVNPEIGTVYGGSCCDNYATIYLDTSQSFYTNYLLYQDGNYMGSYYDKTGNYGIVTFLPVPWPHTYTVKADSCGTLRQMSGYARVDHSCCKGKQNDSESIESFETKLKVYPNPNSGSLFIENDIIGDYILYNEIGKEMRQIEFKYPKMHIEISGLEPGVYYIRCKSGSLTDVFKFTVLE